MMKLKPQQQQSALFVAIALLMAATRYHHFGLTLHLPDASLAVFFLAGFYLRNALALPLLLLGAGLIDYLAIGVSGVSDWCFTPAYWFLIPAYAVLWAGGRWYAGKHQPHWRTLVPLVGALFVTSTLAFAISNASFYLLSGRVPGMGWLDYSSTVATKYYLSYIGWTFSYAALAALLHAAVAAVRQPGVSRPGS